MNDIPAFLQHLKKLAQGYHETYLALETRYQEVQSKDEFLIELKQREAALLNRFRLVQKQLLASLEEEELENALELSKIFDEIRVINQFVIQALAEGDEFEGDKMEG